MKDVYEEQLIRRTMEPKYAFYKGSCFCVIALCVLAAAFVHTMLLFVALLLGVGLYFLFPYFSVEFEYIYVNGELDFDKIYGQKNRKRVITVEMSNLEMIGPKGSHAMDSMRTMKCKEYDFTANEPDHTVYEMYIRVNQELTRIFFEPKEEILEAIRQISPRKVANH